MQKSKVNSKNAKKVVIMSKIPKAKMGGRKMTAFSGPTDPQKIRWAKMVEKGITPPDPIVEQIEKDVKKAKKLISNISDCGVLRALSNVARDKMNIIKTQMACSCLQEKECQTVMANKAEIVLQNK